MLLLALGCTEPGSGDGSTWGGSSTTTQEPSPASSSGPHDGTTGSASTGPASSSSGLDTSTSATSSDETDTGSTGSTGSTGEPVDPEPPVPAGLITYVTGDPADADVDPTGPGLVLMGGGSDVDEAFAWWGGLIAGGDVVVIRISGSDGYNDYLYDFGNADSVETMIVTAELAAADYVSWKLRHAEAIWIAGGDQAAYLLAWKDTAVEQAIHEAWDRGAVVGGTSAGLAVLGPYMFAAYEDTVYSYEALEDPYNQYMTMEQGFLELPMLAGIITDSHFAERDRMGRLIGFLARIHADGWATTATGMGVDEATAVVVGPDGEGTVLGAGHVYVVQADQPPQTCMPGVPLEYDGLEYFVLSAGGALSLPSGQAGVLHAPISAAGGVTIPADPYP
jgi:cyanophycinase